MTITSSVKLAGGTLSVCGRTVLSGVPANVVPSSASAAGAVNGIFIGADFAEPDSRHVMSLGALRGLRFMACFRSKFWWMSQWMGNKGSDVPYETQFLLVESRAAGGDGGEDAAASYVVFLPLVDGAFRASLQGGASGDDALELCVESGDADTCAATFDRALFVGAAESDPFAAIAGAVAAVKSALKTFRVRAEKKLPGIVDYFGWCTWDAFYQDVTQDGVDAGLRALVAGGVPPKFVIIDDGWQSVATDDDDFAGDAKHKQPLLPRLTGIKENAKFQNAGVDQGTSHGQGGALNPWETSVGCAPRGTSPPSLFRRRRSVTDLSILDSSLSSTAPAYKTPCQAPIRTLAGPGLLPCSAAATVVEEGSGEGGEEGTGEGAQEHRVIALNPAVHFVKPEEAWRRPATGAHHRRSSRRGEPSPPSPDPRRRLPPSEPRAFTRPATPTPPPHGEPEDEDLTSEDHYDNYPHDEAWDYTGDEAEEFDPNFDHYYD